MNCPSPKISNPWGLCSLIVIVYIFVYHRRAVNLTTCLDEGDGKAEKLAVCKQPHGGAAKRITS